MRAPVENVPDHVKAYLDKYRPPTSARYTPGTGARDAGTPVQGPVGTLELLELNEDLKDMIAKNPGLGDLRRAAIQNGMITLREDGLNKVAEGNTTVEEIMRSHGNLESQ